MRRTTLAALAALGATALAGCGGGGQPQTQRSAEPSESSSPSCSGGEVRLLQGQPADLPGGGTGGIGQVRRTDPPTVDLALGGSGVEAGQGLGVGDTFSVQGTTYRIACISASVVTVDRAPA